jgi:hypothetical protein
MHVPYVTRDANKLSHEAEVTTCTLWNNFMFNVSNYTAFYVSMEKVKCTMYIVFNCAWNTYNIK